MRKEPRQKIFVICLESDIQALDAIAQRNDVTRSQVVRAAIRKYLAESQYRQL